MVFKVGDRVKIKKTSEYYNLGKANPKIVGTIEDIHVQSAFGLSIKVQWDNGLKNTYSEKDLVDSEKDLVEPGPELVYVVKFDEISYEFATEYEALSKMTEIKNKSF